MSSLINYFKEVRSEFYNITWPKKDTLIQLTVVVISISIIVSSLLGGLDYLFTNSIGWLATTRAPKPTPIINIQTGPSPTEAPTIAPPTSSAKPTIKK
jgi:preprotein translocase subunit SecE